MKDQKLHNLDYREPEWVAQKLGLDKNTVYKFLQDGTIPAIQIGRKWLISQRRLAQWLRRETEKQTLARREAAATAQRTVRRMDTLTPAAQLAIKHAHAEARRYGHQHLGQEHLLLGLSADPRSPAGRALNELSITPGAIRRGIESHAPPSEQPVARRLGRTAEAKKAMRIAARLAGRASPADQNQLVGTAHLLQGILLCRQGLGFEILRQHHVTRRRLREALRGLNTDENPPTQGESNATSR